MEHVCASFNFVVSYVNTVSQFHRMASRYYFYFTFTSLSTVCDKNEEKQDQKIVDPMIFNVPRVILNKLYRDKSNLIWEGKITIFYLFSKSEKDFRSDLSNYRTNFLKLLGRETF